MAEDKGFITFKGTTVGVTDAFYMTPGIGERSSYGQC